MRLCVRSGASLAAVAALAGCVSSAPHRDEAALRTTLAGAIDATARYDGASLTYSVATDSGSAERRTVACIGFVTEQRARSPHGERSNMTVWTDPAVSDGRCLGGSEAHDVVVDGTTMWISTGERVTGSIACATSYRTYRVTPAARARLASTKPRFATISGDALVAAVTEVHREDGDPGHVLATLDPKAAVRAVAAARQGAAPDTVGLDARLDDRGRVTDLTVTASAGSQRVEIRERFEKIGQPQGVAAPDRRCIRPGVTPLTSTAQFSELAGLGTATG